MENTQFPEMPPSLDSTNTTQDDLVCKTCGGKLEFKPGSRNLECPFCGAKNEIAVKAHGFATALQELDYYQAINNSISDNMMEELHTVKCQACGAETTFDNNVVSSKCDFCGSPLTIKQDNTVKKIKPRSLIPFAIDKKQAQEKFNSWINGLWFAPSDIKRATSIEGGINGVYTPYWTYDAICDTAYTGQRGEYYYIEEEYKDSEGKTQTRKKQQTRWRDTRGMVHNNFDDILVAASNSLPSTILDHLGKWDLKELLPYDEKYMAGFKAETYSVDIQEGMEKAKKEMEDEIENSICEQIGGDDQRIDTKHIDMHDVTFKHILLPLWISAFKYGDKTYRFAINGTNGQLTGDRPFSGLKITLFILGIIAAITALVLILR